MQTLSAYPLQQPHQLWPRRQTATAPVPGQPAGQAARDFTTFQTPIRLAAPALLFVDTPAASSRGQQLAPGVWYDQSRSTREGAPVRVLTVDARKARIEPIFKPDGRALGPTDLAADPTILAAINASFFGSHAIAGDLKAGAAAYRDERFDAKVDAITDQRYYLGITTSGQIIAGRGGLSETERENKLSAFVGGLGLLFTREQSGRLEQDIRSGALAKRVFYKGTSQQETISRAFAGINARGELLLVTLGAGSRRSQGASIAEAAELLRDLGAQEAYILDGGGSTSLYLKDGGGTRTDGRRVKSYLAIRSAS